MKGSEIPPEVDETRNKENKLGSEGPIWRTEKKIQKIFHLQDKYIYDCKNVINLVITARWAKGEIGFESKRN